MFLNRHESVAVFEEIMCGERKDGYSFHGWMQYRTMFSGKSKYLKYKISISWIRNRRLRTSNIGPDDTEDIQRK